MINYFSISILRFLMVFLDINLMKNLSDIGLSDFSIK